MKPLKQTSQWSKVNCLVVLLKSRRCTRRTVLKSTKYSHKKEIESLFFLSSFHRTIGMPLSDSTSSVFQQRGWDTFGGQYYSLNFGSIWYQIYLCCHMVYPALICLVRNKTNTFSFFLLLRQMSQNVQKLGPTKKKEKFNNSDTWLALRDYWLSRMGSHCCKRFTVSLDKIIHIKVGLWAR